MVYMSPNLRDSLLDSIKTGTISAKTLLEKVNTYSMKVELDEVRCFERCAGYRVYRASDLSTHACPSSVVLLTGLVLSDIRHNIKQVEHVRPGWTSIGALRDRCHWICKRLKGECAAVTGSSICKAGPPGIIRSNLQWQTLEAKVVRHTLSDRSGR